MTDPIAEVRQRRAETKARQSRGEAMADGWTGQHIDLLLAEIARLESVRADIVAENRRADYENDRLNRMLHDRGVVQLQENLAACETRLYEALADALRLRQEIERLRADETQSQEIERLFSIIHQRDIEVERLNAEVEQLKADADNDGSLIKSLRRGLEEICKAIGIPRGTENWSIWIERVRTEIARLRVPPEGDVMEIARSALGYTVHPERILNDPKRFPDVYAVARALTRERSDVHAKYAPLVEAANHVIEISRQTTPHLSLSGKEQRLEDALRAIGEK